MRNKIETLEKLIMFELRDMYDAERKIVKTLPKMLRMASNKELKQAFSEHTEETKEQIRRLEKISKMLRMNIKGKKCKGIRGIIEEGKEILKAKKKFSPELMDAALIGAAQRVEHYEIAAYGCISAYAQKLGMTEIADLIKQTLEEEGRTDKLLTSISEEKIIK